jgi:hypothetical protein
MGPVVRSQLLENASNVTFHGVFSDFKPGQQFLAVPSMVSRDLCRHRSVDSLFPEMVFDLFKSRAGSLQIFLRVAFYFRLSMLAALQLVARLFQTQSQLGSVDRRGVALAGHRRARSSTDPSGIFLRVAHPFFHDGYVLVDLLVLAWSLRSPLGSPIQ